MNRVTWKDGRYSSKYGYAGAVLLFGIYYRTKSTDPRYHLRTELPGFKDRRWEDDDQQILKEKAERILANWFSYVDKERSEPATPDDPAGS